MALTEVKAEPLPSIDVLVVGEALVDIVVAHGIETEVPGGSPANVALGLGRLGTDVALLTCLADDARGRSITAHLEESGVVVLPESFSAGRTSTAKGIIAPDGHATYEFDVEWRVAADPPPLRPRALHTGSIAAFLEPGASAVGRHLESTTAPMVSFDPNIRPALIGPRDEARAVFERVSARCTLVKLSDEDLDWLYPGESIDAVLQRVLSLGPSLVAVTLGGDGSVLRSRTGASAQVAAPRVAVVDTIGAGDTYMASLISSMLGRDSAGLTEADLREIGETAASAAAVTVSRAGADLPWRDEIDRPLGYS